MDAVLPRHEPEDVVRPPRPGGLLTAAAAVPLGAAVLLAAGHLPGGARAVVGVAVVVLGLALLRTHGTVTGARLGPGLSDALGAIVIVLGVGLVAGPLAVEIDGSEGGLGGWGAVLFWLALAATAVALLGAPEGGRATMRAAESLLGVSVAVAFVALLGAGALVLDEEERSVVVLVAAALATGAAATARTDAGGPRVAVVVAAVLLACVGGEATQLVGIVTGNLLPGAAESGASEAFASVRAGLVLLVAAALLVVAARRRYVVGAVLASALLLTAGSGDDAATALWAVPLAGLLVTGLLVASAPARTGAGRLLGRVMRGDATDVDGGDGGAALSRDAALAALAVACVTLAGTIGGLNPDAPALAALAVVALAAVVLALCVLLPGAPGVVAALAGLAAIHLTQPALAAVAALWRSGFEEYDTAVVVAVTVVHLAAVLVVLRRHREPAVLALAAVVVAGQIGTMLFIVLGRGEGLDLTLVLLASLGAPTVGLVVAAALALVGPARVLRQAQAVGAGLAYAAAVAAPTLGGYGGIGRPTDGSSPALLQGADRVVAVLLVVALLLGLALLAASVARRPSVAVTAGVLLGGVQAALFAGLVGAAVRAGADVLPTAPSDPLLGFAAAGSGVRDSGAAWPLLFGALGAVLLAAAWWLESRRPLPADAPLGG
ncbi:hypothetical protein [Patulibacter americanus]|uniref:hypothetical protein n=1 Tax=Patulibacter americanus TaxID=588672 RepID=UPI0003B5D638|nr:hypothetical protein [Patulibacter americanus]